MGSTKGSSKYGRWSWCLMTTCSRRSGRSPTVAQLELVASRAALTACRPSSRPEQRPPRAELRCPAVQRWYGGALQIFDEILETSLPILMSAKKQTFFDVIRLFQKSKKSPWSLGEENGGYIRCSYRQVTLIKKVSQTWWRLCTLKEQKLKTC